MADPWEPYEPWRAWQGKLSPAEEERFRAELDAALASGTVTRVPPIRDVAGYCPMGCGPHLHVMSGGLIMCLSPKCPDPGAVTKILSDPEHLDVVTFSDGHFNVLHPLRERIGGVLLSCPVAEALERISGPPENYEGRRYRASLDENGQLVLKAFAPEGS